MSFTGRRWGYSPLVMGLMVLIMIMDNSKKNDRRLASSGEENHETMHPKRAITTESVWSNVDFGVRKHWSLATKNQCSKTHDCTPSGYRWPHVMHPNPCQALKPGTRILFLGDSYVRHAYIAFVLWLSNDYEKGALKQTHDKECHYQGQFKERNCRAQLDFHKTVCVGGDSAGVTVEMAWSQWFRPHDIEKRGGLQQYDHIILGGGSWPIHADLWASVHNAHVASKLVLEPFCAEHSNTAATANEKFIYLDTHVRLKAYLWPYAGFNRQYHDPGESFARIHQYHNQMPIELAKSECNITKVVSAYEATLELAQNHTVEAFDMTHDGVHWNMEVNLIKAHEILNTMILASLPSQPAPKKHPHNGTAIY